MFNSSRSLAWCACVVFLLFARASHGQTPAQLEARDRFEEGLKHAQANDLEAAIRSFEAAYAAQPHYSVLYNIAQAQLALGRPAAALERFEQYLAEGRGQIGDTRLAEAKALIAVCRRRLGTLQLRLEAPARTRVWLDGVEVDRQRLLAPLLVNVGKHTVLYAGEAGPPHSLEVMVSHSTPSELRIPAPAVPNEPARLRVDCPVPGIMVMVDGKLVAQTPVIEPLPLEPGERIVSVTGRGYRDVRRTMRLSPRQLATVACDSRPAHDGARRDAQRKTLAYLLGGSGAAVLLSGGALLLWNHRRYETWQASRASDADLDRVASLQRVDDLAIGLVLIGAGLGAGGAWLFFDEPRRDH